MGTELEYGVSVPGQPGANPTTLSSQVVNAWAVAGASTPRRARWDFEEESPLRDARGFDLSPANALDHADLEVVRGFVDSGQLTPVLDRQVALSGVPGAMRDLEQGLVRGKAVVTL